MQFARHYPDFFTATCLNWTDVLRQDQYKDIVIDSLRFMVRNERAIVYAFVIMTNHIHLVWQFIGQHQREAVQRDFLKFTSQQILKDLRNKKSTLQLELLVNASDRKFQVWERNPLSIPLVSEKMTEQKIKYIHENPVRKGWCVHPEDYHYSSARFYLCNERNWDFLTHCLG